MAYKRFDPEDVVLSTDVVSTPVWTGNVSTLNKADLFTSSLQQNGLSGLYYLDIYKSVSPQVSGSTVSGSAAVDLGSKEVQFSIAYGDVEGSGSIAYNKDASLAHLSPSRTIYGQFRSQVLGDEDSEFYLADDQTPTKAFFAIVIDRARYREKLMLGSIKISFNGGKTLTLKDNSAYGGTVKYVDSGRLYRMIDERSTEENISYYGYLLPDTGIILLDAEKLCTAIGLKLDEIRYSSTAEIDSEKQTLSPMEQLFNVISSFTVQSEETITSNYVFVRARNAEFNYSTNPSNITGSGELRHDIMINQPQAFITAVGLYNDSNDLLAVAKLSRPLIKDFTKESIIRVKLDY